MKSVNETALRQLYFSNATDSQVDKLCKQIFLDEIKPLSHDVLNLFNLVFSYTTIYKGRHAEERDMYLGQPMLHSVICFLIFLLFFIICYLFFKSSIIPSLIIGFIAFILYLYFGNKPSVMLYETFKKVNMSFEKTKNKLRDCIGVSNKQSPPESATPLKERAFLEYDELKRTLDDFIADYQKMGKEIRQELNGIKQTISLLDQNQAKVQALTEELSCFESYEEHILKELLDKYYLYAYDDDTKPFYEFIINLAKSRESLSGERYEIITNPEDNGGLFIEKEPYPGQESQMIIPALVKIDKSGNICKTILNGFIIKPE